MVPSNLIFARNLLQATRDTVRRTLVDIVETVGPKFLLFIVNELRSTLTRGFELHVLGYVTHALLDHTVNKMKVDPGSLDYALPSLLEVTFGYASEQCQ